MAAKLKTIGRVTEIAFDVAGKSKRFLRFCLNDTGSLVLILESGFVDAAEISSKPAPHLRGTVIRERHFSIHPSLHLPEENIIHFKALSDEGKKISDTRHYTKAVKSKSYFAPIACFLHSSEIADSSEDVAESIILDQFDPADFTPIYSLFVSHPEREFKGAGDDLNIFQTVIGGFRIVIVWSFAHMRTASAGILRHAPTFDLSKIKDEEERATYSRFTRGLDEKECVHWHKSSRHRIRDLHINWIEFTYPWVTMSNPGWIEYCKFAFHKKASRNTVEYQVFHLRWLSRPSHMHTQTS